jgi:hypothetical protein
MYGLCIYMGNSNLYSELTRFRNCQECFERDLASYLRADQRVSHSHPATRLSIARIN